MATSATTTSPRGPMRPNPPKPQVRIEGWKIIESPLGGYKLWGERVFGHPFIREDEGSITTSLLVRIDFASCTAETLNTAYILGEPLEPRLH